jgi:hypothetical protein
MVPKIMLPTITEALSKYLLGVEIDVSGPLIGRSIIDSLRSKTLCTSIQMQQGDYFMDRSRVLLRRHLQLDSKFVSKNAIRENVLTS